MTFGVQVLMQPERLCYAHAHTHTLMSVLLYFCRKPSSRNFQPKPQRGSHINLKTTTHKQLKCPHVAGEMCKKVLTLLRNTQAHDLLTI